MGRKYTPPNPPNSILKFNIGDRVECKGMMSNLNLDGQTGEIIDVTSGTLFRVKFDIKFSNRLHSEDKMCWDVYKENLLYNNGVKYTEEENKWWLDE